MSRARLRDNYYVRWLVHAFRGPWGIASLVGSILALAIPAALRYIPTLSARAASVNDLLWQVPVGVLALLVAVRLLTVPRQLHAEQVQRALDAERRFQQLEEERRPTVVVERYDELIEDDPQAEGPYTREYLRFTNVGAETALTVQIDPVDLGGHDVALWEPIHLLKPGDETDRMPRGGISSGIARVRKAAQIEYHLEVRLPMVVKYFDRRGTEWSTPHAIVARGNNVRVEPVASVTAVKWTDLKLPT